MRSKKELGRCMIEHGQLSEYHQKLENYYMYDYHHAQYLKLKAQYRGLS